MYYNIRMVIIAEIGTSHKASLERAFFLIDEAAASGADCVKFQWVYADEILHPKTDLVSLPTGQVALYDSFKSLECDADFYKQCRDYAHSKNLLFACSVFGLRSLSELLSLHPDAVKVASPEINHIRLLRELSKSFGRIPIIISGGVSKLSDIERAVDLITEGKSTPEMKGPLPALTILHCVTSYPAPPEDCNVRCVDTLRRVFGFPTGMSDHSLDPVLIPSLATFAGAAAIEKHITLNHADGGLDDPVALEGEQFALMTHAVKQTRAILEKHLQNTEDEEVARENAKEEVFRQLSYTYDRDLIKKAYGDGVKRLAPSEAQNYGRTNRSLHYMRDMKAGERVGETGIASLRTEKVLSVGVSPELLETLLGARLTRDVEDGAGVSLDDFLAK